MDARIDGVFAPNERSCWDGDDDMRGQLYRIFGPNLTAIPGISALTAHAVPAEVGRSLSRSANAAAFADSLALCPSNKRSGGTVLSSKTRPTSKRRPVRYRTGAFNRRQPFCSFGIIPGRQLGG